MYSMRFIFAVLLCYLISLRDIKVFVELFAILILALTI